MAQLLYWIALECAAKRGLVAAQLLRLNRCLHCSLNAFFYST